MSFTSETKNHICEERVKKNCCRGALLYGVLLFANSCSESGICLYNENQRVLSLVSELTAELKLGSGLVEIAGENNRIGSRFTLTDTKAFFDRFGGAGADERHIIQENLLRCTSCHRHFLRGVFLSCGSLIDPEFSYHLEFSVPDEALAEDLMALLMKHGVLTKRFSRGSDEVVYTKDSETIEDFLNLIGEQKAAFEIMNKKIKKAIRNETNRIVNCETSNLAKTISAAQECISAIAELKKSGRFVALPEELRETADLRIQHSEANLTQLAALHTPPISKSGVNHRIQKIIEFSKK